jgi:hypothetical protein
MFEIGAGMIFYQALVIMGLLYLFARQEADYEYTKVVLVTCGVVAGNFLLAILLAPKLGLLVFLLLLAYTAFMLEKFCWVSWGRAILIAVLYFALTIGFEMARVRFITGEWRTPKTEPEPEVWKFPEEDARTAEALAVLKDMTPAYSNRPGDAVELDEPDEDETEPGTAPAAAPAPAVPAAPLVPETAPPPSLRPLQHSPAPRVAAPVAAPVAPVPDDRLDWAGARSALRLRGVMKDAQGRTAAMVGTNIVPVGAEFSAAWQGVRYTWRLEGLVDRRAEWQQVRAEIAP